MGLSWGQLTALPQTLAEFGGRFAAGRGAGLGQRRGRGRKGKWRGGKGGPPSYC